MEAWWRIALPIWGWIVCLQLIIGCHNVLSLITHVINQTAFDRAHHRTWLDASLVIKSCHIFPFHFSSLRGWGCRGCAGSNCVEGHRYQLYEYTCVDIADSEQTCQCQGKVHYFFSTVLDKKGFVLPTSKNDHEKDKSINFFLNNSN